MRQRFKLKTHLEIDAHKKTQFWEGSRYLRQGQIIAVNADNRLLARNLWTYIVAKKANR